MLKRQRILLSILQEAGRSLSHVELVKAAFLLEQETVVSEQAAFYEFVPYKFGPFSFALYRELAALTRDGYIHDEDKAVRLVDRTAQQISEQIASLPQAWKKSVKQIVTQYLGASQNELLGSIYKRYPWFAINSDLTHLVPEKTERPRAQLAVYTVGYEGKSVDGFFNELIESGVESILDVRANPISRKYGFARKSMSEIAAKLGIEYRHMPALGISSSDRSALSDYESYQRLLNRYESEMLPTQGEAIAEAVAAVQTKPSALLCMEKDVTYCHRGRLANVIEKKAKLDVQHL